MYAIARFTAHLIVKFRHVIPTFTITQTLLRELTGAHPRFIRPVLDANVDLMEADHQELGILAAHNRTPAPKPEPISKALSIAEHPADLSCLEEIALPASDPSSAGD